MLRFKRFSTVLAILLLSLVSTPQSNAHTGLVGTSPSDGQKVYANVESLTLEFSDKVELLPNAFQLFNSSGEVLELGKPKLIELENFTTITIPTLGNISEGWYAVGWKVVSKDGHPVSGAYSFSVDLNSDGEVGVIGSSDLLKSIANPYSYLKPFIILGKTLGYASTIIAAGIVFFLILVPKGKQGLINKLCKYVSLSTLVGIVATVFSWILDVFVLYGNSSAIFKLITLPPGKSYLVRLFALATIIPICLLIKHGVMKIIILSIFSIISLYSFTISGHTSILEPKWLASTSLIAHLFAASVWVGGLFALFIALKQLRIDDPEVAALVTGRFSIAASAALALMSVAASSLAIITLGDLSNLFSTNYGRSLLAKLTIVLLIVLLGAYNHYILVPKIIQKNIVSFADNSVVVTSSSDNATQQNTALSLLYRVLKFEIFAIIAIAIATAIMTSYTAPRVVDYYGSSAEAGENYWAGVLPGHMHIPGMNMANLYGRFDFSADGKEVLSSDTTPERIVGSGTIDDYVFTLTLASNNKGPLLKIIGVDSNGNKASFQQVDVVFEHKVSGVGPLIRNAKPSGDAWEVSADDLQIAGNWSVTIKANIDNFSLVKGTLGITIS